MWSSLPLGERLRAELGPPRKARRLVSSPRSRIWRAELSGVPVVVKQLVDSPGVEERFAREAAALALASRRAGRTGRPVVPALLGTDPTARVLVLERLVDRTPGPDWLAHYATALAGLHASAPADLDDLAGTAPATALPTWTGPTGRDLGCFIALARALDVPAPPGARAEAEDLLARLSATPVRHALLHGDPCPGNDLHTADGVRFVDFEQAALGPGAAEFAYLRTGFPTCRCSTAPPPAVLAEAEAAYRATWRAATGTEAAGRAELADACAGWLLRGDALVPRAERGTADYLARLHHADWTWGNTTARRRLLHRVRAVAALADADTALPIFGRFCATLATRIRTAWPTAGPLPGDRD
ncbi:phosphotransferase [Kitasatospora sp. CB01950]|uniref:phosphotransferase n=1 Tax=Kitasatospora sp. CB01950 TaxID=1703930 RepID=UPI00093EA207|nr:phosphotransferase [Kitasatospora sp. CB01950]OKJ07571.1 aminoglycoside phosphotransferase [Kitasatospora sp. CB01950]